MNLFLYQGNNYYNRKIIHANSNDEYINRSFRQIASVNSVAFIVNDGITTSQVINYDHNELGFGDYVIVYDDYNTITSRWWVVKNTVVRNGQVMMQLLRDVISDWYDDILKAPAYVKKGTITSVNDPAIFNNESMTFNQIKTWEKPIRDKTLCGWYVGYLAKRKETDATPITVTVPGTPVNKSEVYATESDYYYSQFTGNNAMKGDITDIIHTLRLYDPSQQTNFMVGWDNDGNAKTPPVDIGFFNNWRNPQTGVVWKGAGPGNEYRGMPSVRSTAKYNELWLNAGQVNNWEQLVIDMGLASSAEQAEDIKKENGKTIKIGDVYYKVTVNTNTTSTIASPINASVYASAILNITNNLTWINNSPEVIQGKFSEIYITQNLYTVSLEETTAQSLTVTIPLNRQQTVGAPYDVFAIPAGASHINTGGEATHKDLSRKLINAIIAETTAELYDVQYLPYCPIGDEYVDSYGRVQLRDLVNNEDRTSYTIVRTESNPKYWTYIIYAENYEFNKESFLNTITVPESVSEYKLANECDIYRLCSPNYNGQFEFSAAKNGGVDSWNIAFTCKPYSPYIRVSPNFSRLYGRNFEDARGLVCGGDFSLTQINDAWENYELQNKNYQKIFDRQIHNMEVNNSVARVKERFSAITGTVTGGVTGGIAGGMAGPYGAIAGAIAGTAVSGMAGITDIAINDKLRAEALDYAKDQYGYNLQNIQALPYSLTKVGAQNKDYKVWPFVEYYTCTDTEKEALLNKIRWNGYTIERIGTFAEFIPDTDTFIQGKIIRLDEIEAGSNITDVINIELQTGVYFT